MELRYMGFDQHQSRRTYKFDGLIKGGGTLHFLVTADLALFLQHHVAIQEGPALCAQKLASGPEGSDQSSFELTKEDLQAHAAARTAAEARKAELRKSGPRRRPAPQGDLDGLGSSGASLYAGGNPLQRRNQ